MIPISQIQKDIISNRLPPELRTPEIIMEYFINNLQLDKDLDKLTDVDKAAELLDKHLVNHSHIVIIGDRDADGICATSLVYKGLIDIFKKSKEHIDVIINPRKEENGVSEYCVNKLFEIHSSNPVDLIITVDHGSRDNIRYKLIKETIPNIDLLITDHHTVEYDDYPTEATVFINPQRKESTYYKTISGCQVGLAVLVATFKRMYPGEGLHIFNTILPYAAITVISDVMSLSNPFNRYIVKTGLHEINKYINPVWVVCKKLLELPGVISSNDIGHKIAPLINTANRTHNEMLGFKFLTADTIEEAKECGLELAELNNKRKTVTRIAVKEADRDIDTLSYPNSIVSLIDTGYAINGLVAAQLGEKYKKPAVCFLDNGNTLNGSCRGIIPGFNILESLTKIQDRHPTRVVKLGGHHGACGITIAKDFLPEFKREFDTEVGKALPNLNKPEPLKVDAVLNKNEITPKLAMVVNECGPYGKDWGEALFLSKLVIHRVVVKGPYLTILFENGLEGGCYVESLNYDTSLLNRGSKVDVIFSMDISNFKGVFNFIINIKELKILD